ncbi:MAG: polyketide synthase [Bacteriovoracaceae bacterium]|nr:polyketide synthase [Bacteriovoracaceae bacterium]
MKRSYQRNDIVITGIGNVLPDAMDYASFENKIFEGKFLFRPIDKDRWKIEDNFSKDLKKDTKTYSTMAAQIKQSDYFSIKKKHNLDLPTDHRALAYLVEAYSQIIEDINFCAENMTLILGSMNPDILFSQQRLHTLFKNMKLNYEKNYPSKKNKDELYDYLDIELEDATSGAGPCSLEGQFHTSMLKRLKEIFPNDYNGSGFLIDSACASSLTSIEVACNVLKSREKDFVIAGGVESNLANGAFVLFSKVGALSPTHAKPFDQSHDGLTQGEGCVLFALERLETALKNKRKIYGVIKGVNGSSDGRSASLFQPTVDGQVMAYRKVWGNIESNPFHVETHGTGTIIGDEVELKSITKYFGGEKVFIGTNKGIFGHTKSTAGATSILKVVAMFNRQLMPSNSHIQQDMFKEIENFEITKSERPLSKYQTHVGISAFGFGGCNYHLALERYDEELDISDIKNKKSSRNVSKTLSIIKSHTLSLNDFELDKMSQNFFPRKSYQQIDILQFAAVECVYKMFPNSQHIFTSIGLEKINILSCGRLGLDKLIDMATKVTCDTLITKLSRKKINPTIKTLLKLIKEEKLKYPILSEDIGPGVLNNVIAGRVANVFNLQGKSYHIDMDLGSYDAALYSIKMNLHSNPNEVYLLIDTTGAFDQENCLYKTTTLKVDLITHPDFSKALGLGQDEEIQFD